jgi:hypothetical protein
MSDESKLPAVRASVPAVCASDEKLIEVDFFGAKGKFIDGRWAIYPSLGNIWAIVAPGSMIPDIRECIEQDVAAGNSDKIAKVLVGPRQGVVLFLEGKITLEHLKNATQTEEFIDIPGVAIDDRVLTVRVLANASLRVATADSEGNVL